MLLRRWNLRMAWGQESTLETVGALGATAPILESISNPSGGAGWSWVGCGCQKDLVSDQIREVLKPVFYCFLFTLFLQFDFSETCFFLNHWNLFSLVLFLLKNETCFPPCFFLKIRKNESPKIFTWVSTFNSSFSSSFNSLLYLLSNILTYDLMET